VTSSLKQNFSQVAQLSSAYNIWAIIPEDSCSPGGRNLARHRWEEFTDFYRHQI